MASRYDTDIQAGVVSPAMDQSRVHLPSYMDIGDINGRANNPSALYPGGEEPRSHDILRDDLVFCHRDLVALRSNTVPRKGNPVFRNFGGLGKLNLQALAKDSSERAAYKVLRAKSQLEHKIFMMGVAIQSVIGSKVDAPSALSVAVQGIVTLPMRQSPAHAGDVVVWTLPRQSAAEGNNKGAAAIADIRPLNREYIADQATYLRKVFIYDRTALDYYREDRMNGASDSEYNDQFEALLRLEDGIFHAGMPLVSAAVRLIFTAMRMPKTRGKAQREAMKLDPLHALRKKLKVKSTTAWTSAEKEGEIVESAVQEFTTWFAGRFAMDNAHNLGEEVSKRARRVMSTAMIDPKSLTNPQYGADIMKSSSPASVHSAKTVYEQVGFLSLDQFTKTARNQIYRPGAADGATGLHTAGSYLARTQRNAFPQMIAAMHQFWHHMASHTIGVMVSNAEPGMQGHCLLRSPA